MSNRVLVPQQVVTSEVPSMAVPKGPDGFLRGVLLQFLEPRLRLA
jgi:hypothetical protein